MKCQACDEQATHHVTDLVDGEPVEYHICEKHLENLNSLDVQNLKV
jgi:protein-arginine kinase activator protein McsA